MGYPNGHQIGAEVAEIVVILRSSLPTGRILLSRSTRFHATQKPFLLKAADDGILQGEKSALGSLMWHYLRD